MKHGEGKKKRIMKRNNFMAIGTDKFRVSVANGDLMITCYDNIVPVIRNTSTRFSQNSTL